MSIPDDLAADLHKACQDLAHVHASMALAKSDLTLTGTEPEVLDLGIQAGITAAVAELHRRGMVVLP